MNLPCITGNPEGVRQSLFECLQHLLLEGFRSRTQRLFDTEWRQFGGCRFQVDRVLQDGNECFRQWR